MTLLSKRKKFILKFIRNLKFGVMFQENLVFLRKNKEENYIK